MRTCESSETLTLSSAGFREPAITDPRAIDEQSQTRRVFKFNRAPFVISGRGPDAPGPPAAGGTSPGSTAAVAFVGSVASR